MCVMRVCVCVCVCVCDEGVCVCVCVCDEGVCVCAQVWSCSLSFLFVWFLCAGAEGTYLLTSSKQLQKIENT